MNVYNINSWKVSTQVLYALGYTILVMSLLLLIQPLGLVKIGLLKKKIWLTTSLGINCGFFSFIQLIGFNYFFNKKLTQTYQIFSYNIFFILLTSLLNVFIILMFFPNKDTFHTTNLFIASIAIISIFHFVYSVSVKQLFTNKKQTVAENNKKVEILSIKDNSSVISIPIEDIYYIKSSGNYIEIIEKNNKKGHLLRFSLKDLDKKYINLYRCHKSFFVNITHITKITGNTKGYKIELDDLKDITIPVSRTKGKQIAKIIS